MLEHTLEPAVESAAAPEIMEGTDVLRLSPEAVKQWLHERRMRGLSPLQDDYSLYMAVLDFDTHRESLLAVGKVDKAIVKKDSQTGRWLVAYNRIEDKR